MKKQFIAYILGSFACSVIILLGFSIIMALSLFYARSESFLAERTAFGSSDFLSGADTFFTIVLLFFYLMFNAFFRKRFNQNSKSRLIKHVIAMTVAIIAVELLIPFSNRIEIVTSFSQLSYPFLAVAVYLQEFHNPKTDTIDRIFSLFSISALSSIVLFLILLIINGIELSFSNSIKFISLLFFAAFFTYLSSYITYNAFRGNNV